MESNRGRIEVRDRNGNKITSFQRFTATDDYTEPLTRFEFDAAPPRPQLQLYKEILVKGEFVTLMINGASQGGFLIQTVKRTISAEGGIGFHVEAVSPLITPYQGSVDPDIVNVHSPTDVPVSEAILKAMAPYGFDRIITDTRSSVNSLTGYQVRNRKRDTDLNKLKHQDAQAQDGETAYQFCARIFTHLGTCLRMSVDGVLLVGSPDYEQSPVSSLVQGEGEGDRFVGAVEIVDTNDDQFSEVVTRGNRVTTPETTRTTRPKSTLKAEGTLNPRSVYKSTPAPHKPKNARNKHARDAARCASVNKLMLGIRAWKAYNVTGTVDGFVSKTGAVWSVDTVVNVKVDGEGLNEKMWIKSRTFTLSNDGAKTKLVLIPLGTLLLGDVPSE